MINENFNNAIIRWNNERWISQKCKEKKQSKAKILYFPEQSKDNCVFGCQGRGKSILVEEFLLAQIKEQQNKTQVIQ